MEWARVLDDGCAIEAEAFVNPFNHCGAALPGKLLIYLYKDRPSVNGGTRVGGSLIGCSFCPGDDGRWRVNLPTAGPGDYYVEAWVNEGSSGVDQRCVLVDSIHREVLPAGDDDGDGVDNCADNCPNVVNALQLDVDADGAGDICDQTKCDLNRDGRCDYGDLNLILPCLRGDLVCCPCEQTCCDCDGGSNCPDESGRCIPEFCFDEKGLPLGDLDGDFDVDFNDLAAFQVFYGE